jgi:hypothetical protein
VISLALDAVVASFYPEKIDADLRAYLDRVTTAATVAIYAPIAAIATRAGHGARDSQSTRGLDADWAADNLATTVAEVAAALRTREEEIAAIVANNAAVAAELVAASVASRANEPETAATAAAMTAVVDDAAADTAMERDRAAALVAQSATVAASQVASTADTVAVTNDVKISKAAAALQAIALQTCYHVALTVGASAAEAVLADGMP